MYRKSFHFVDGTQMKEITLEDVYQLHFLSYQNNLADIDFLLKQTPF